MKNLSNKEANKVTRECLQTALIQLMSQKPFEKITITELVRRSGVSRTAFYRNYESKEEILNEVCRSFIDSLSDSFSDPTFQKDPVLCIRKNMAGIKAQLSRFIDFNSTASNAAIMLNNYDWMKQFSFLDFIREIGKHITVNYMMAKDSVKKRLSSESAQGMSFTEFTYQLVQGYDFLHLRKNYGCMLQMGGSDQWGNITTGAELIRRTNGGEVFALTCPLITKADGGKFGKTESGNIWLDPRYTSPYKFYQFWLNVSDSDAERYIKIFTSIEKEEIEALIAEHQAAPHLRILQKRLAKEVTVMVHSEDDYNAAVDASNILFGNATSETLRKLDEDTLLAVFEGVPQFEISRDALTGGVKAVDLFVDNAAVFASKGEMRKLVQGGGVSLNKEKLAAFDQVITAADLLDEKYLLVQRGKKNYYLLIAK